MSTTVPGLTFASIFYLEKFPFPLQRLCKILPKKKPVVGCSHRPQNLNKKCVRRRKVLEDTTKVNVNFFPPFLLHNLCLYLQETSERSQFLTYLTKNKKKLCRDFKFFPPSPNVFWHPTLMHNLLNLEKEENFSCNNVYLHIYVPSNAYFFSISIFFSSKVTYKKEYIAGFCKNFLEVSQRSLFLTQCFFFRAQYWILWILCKNPMFMFKTVNILF